MPVRSVPKVKGLWEVVWATERRARPLREASRSLREGEKIIKIGSEVRLRSLGCLLRKPRLRTMLGRVSNVGGCVVETKTSLDPSGFIEYKGHFSLT